MSYWVDLLKKCQDGDDEAIDKFTKFGYPINIIVSDIDIDEIKNLADGGNSYAMVLLGFIYVENDRDYEKAISLYEKAVELNNYTALKKLVNLYRSGGFVIQDLQKINSLFDRVIDSNCHEAMLDMATMYYFGFGIRKNFGKAVSLMEKAAGLNNIQAINNLAYLYRSGKIGKRDMYKALDLYIMIKNREKCLLVMKKIIDDKCFDIEKIIRLFGNHDIFSECNDIPVCVKNMGNVIGFFNKKILGMNLLRKNMPGDMIGEISKYIF